MHASATIVRFLLSLLLIASLAAGSALADDERVVILKPRPQDLLLGETEIALLLQGVDDADVTRVTILVDAREAGVITEPPWRTTIDVGQNVGPKTIQAVVTLGDGRRLRGILESRPAGLDTVEVRLVNLSVTVTDGDRPVLDLERGDFQVFDSGRPIEIERWDNEPATLAVALVIDASLTMKGRKLESAKSAARSFIRALERRDLVSVVAFSESSAVLHDLSTEHSDAADVLEALTPGGGTALYDSVYDTAKHLADAPPNSRKIAVILSDGRDESASGLEPGSFHTLEEAIRRSHKSDLILFTIGLGSGLEEQPDFSGRMTTAEVLERMASSTGGRAFRVRRFSRLARTYDQILEELRQQYHIAYPPPPTRPGETWRPIEVRVSRPGLVIRTREGYFVD